MTQNEYGLFDGSVYKKAPQAKFTYVFCSSVHDFVHYLLGCPEIADQIVAQVTPIINLLSVSSCRIIKPLIVDYNFIEVAPYGTCFNISEKCFQVDPPTLKGTYYFLLNCFHVFFLPCLRGQISQIIDKIVNSEALTFFQALRVLSLSTPTTLTSYRTLSHSSKVWRIHSVTLESGRSSTKSTINC